MNKNIKYLIETFTDDLDNELDFHDEGNITVEDYENAYIQDCVSPKQLTDILFRKYDIVNQFLKGINNYSYYTNISIHIKYNYSDGKKHIENIISNRIKDIDIVCEKAPQSKDNFYFRLGNMQTYIFNAKDLIQGKNIGELSENLKTLIANTFNVNRMIEDFTSNNKPYKVVQKDIDRMSNCIDNTKGAWNGYAAITDVKKLVPRAAAALIVLNKRHMINIDDDLVEALAMFTYCGKHHAYTPTTMNVASILHYVFYHLKDKAYIRDVMRTYYAYVDKF